jgi:hypothetical protein
MVKLCTVVVAILGFQSIQITNYLEGHMRNIPTISKTEGTKGVLFFFNVEYICIFIFQEALPLNQVIFILQEALQFSSGHFYFSGSLAINQVKSAYIYHYIYVTNSTRLVVSCMMNIQL